MEATVGGRNGATLLEVVPEFPFSLRALVAKGGVSRQFRSVAPFASLTCATAFQRGRSQHQPDLISVSLADSSWEAVAHVEATVGGRNGATLQNCREGFH